MYIYIYISRYIKYIYSYIKNKKNILQVYWWPLHDMGRFRTRTTRLHEWLKQKTSSIKFKFKYSQTKIEFLDVLVNKDHNNMLQTTIYREQTDWQNYLDARSEHPKVLKDRIPCNQALRIKWICSSQQEFIRHIAKKINQSRKHGYDKSIIEQQINKANLQEREQLLKDKKKLSQISVFRSNAIEHSLK